MHWYAYIKQYDVCVSVSSNQNKQNIFSHPAGVMLLFFIDNVMDLFLRVVLVLRCCNFMYINSFYTYTYTFYTRKIVGRRDT